MALVTIVGYPCSGKSRLAAALLEDFERRLPHGGTLHKAVIVSDDNSHVPRTVYDDSISEKSGRGNLFTNVTRSVSPDTITICDSPNYIKGFRYQMYCAAREAQIRTCTIHVATPRSKCEEWHENRGESSYKPETFDNLIMRFEEPSSMVRWDSPLITIPWDEDPPFDEIWEVIIKGSKKPPTAAVATRPRPPPGSLQTLTATTSLITTSLLAHLNAAPTSTTYPIPSPPADTPLVLHLPMRRVTLPEMQRLKRQFESVQTKAQSSGGLAAGRWSEEQVTAGFVSFLEESWGV